MTPRAPSVCRVGAREEEEHAGMGPVRDPLLRAGDPPAVLRRLGASPQRRCVGARAPVPSARRRRGLAAGKRRDEAALLLVGAEGENRKRRGARVNRNRDADAGVGSRELLEHEDVREEVGPRSPYSSGTHTPIRPRSASRVNSSRGNRCSRSHSAACGSISASANSRVSAWISRCSGASAKFISRKMLRVFRDLKVHATSRCGSGGHSPPPPNPSGAAPRQ